MPSLPCYGRPYTFAAECPACAEILIVRSGRGGGATSTSLVEMPSSRIWQPLASLLTCPSCGRYWVMGLSMYALEIVAPMIRLPHDQRLTLRQAALVRSRIGGSWVTPEEPREGPTIPIIEEHPRRSTTLTHECTCSVTGREGCTRHRRSWGE